MLKIILVGANGRMGRTIAASAVNMEIVCGIDVNTQRYGEFPILGDINNYEGYADVIIDFSHPDNLAATVKYAAIRSIPAVIATTGLNQQAMELIRETAKLVPIFFSANMSLGISLLTELVKKAASVLTDFDVEIIEKHHNKKIDAPSGTALAIAAAISEVDEGLRYVYDRHNVRTKRDKKEMGIHTVRGGTIVGEHTVLFAGVDEVIEITHQAASKEVFAVGALRAAEFIVNCSPGFYNMSDMVSHKFGTLSTAH